MDCRPSQARKKTGGAMRKTSVRWMLLAVLALAPTAVLAQQAAQGQAEKPPAKTEAKKEEAKQEETQKQTEEPKKEEDSTLTSVPGGKALGMSILGNQEAPKALVIVPWKSSELGNGPSVSTMLRLEATDRQGGIPANAQLLRNQFGNGAPQR